MKIQSKTEATGLIRTGGLRQLESRRVKNILMGIVVAMAMMVQHRALAAAGPEVVDLGVTADFVILAGAAITSTGGGIISGDVGASPIAGSAIGLNAAQVNGTIYTVDASGPAGSVTAPALLTAAKGDMTAAYNDAAGRTPIPSGPFLNPGSGDIGGMNLGPGLYKFTGTALITMFDLTLTGGPEDVWIFQVGADLQVGRGVYTILAGGARAKNIFWQVGTSATLGTYSSFKGTILADQAITFNTGSKLEGRALAFTAGVVFNGASANLPTPLSPVNGGVGLSRAGDFDGDGRADQTVYDEATGDWYILGMTGTVLKWAHNWGGTGFVPFAGNFDLAEPDELVAFDPVSARWYVQKMDGTVLADGIQWGMTDGIPLVGDFGGDDSDDLAILDPASARWYIRTLEGGQILAWGVQWGYTGVVPQAGDFNGDGKDDLAVFDPVNGRWYIRTLAGQVLAWGIQWGPRGAIPVPANYDGDTQGRCDLGVFDPITSKWYARTLAGQVPVWGVQWGFPGVIPLVGDYSGDGLVDVGVYDQIGGGRWYLRALSGQVLRWNHKWGTRLMVPLGGIY